MSFTFNWPRFSDQFHHDAIQMLNTALNKGNKPPIIADKIEVVELEMGTQPPELEIRDIGDLTVDQFRGIFRLTYSGDAHLVLKTKVQANPLNHKQPDIHLMTGSRSMLAANQPLAVPMLLRLSHFRLSSYVVLVVSKQKGITLVFKTDPLQNVDINSTFDSIAVIQKFIQREIEGQLRQMFREDLPGIIHRLSQQWFKAKVEAPYLNKRPPQKQTNPQPFETMSSPDLTSARAGSSGLSPHLGRAQSLGVPSVKRPRSVSGNSVASSNRRASMNKAAATVPPISQISSPDSTSHNEYENFDPTYGLRPEGLPTKSGFKGFSSLFTPNKGLADLTEEPTGQEDEVDYEDDGESTSYDVVEWEDTVPGISPPRSIYMEQANTPEYETLPAVGGGTITRPRILHSQSGIQLPAGITPCAPILSPYSRSRSSVRSGAVTPNTLTRHNSSGSSYFPDTQSFHNKSQTLHFPPRPRTPDSADSNTGDNVNDHYPPHLTPQRMGPPGPISPTQYAYLHTHLQESYPSSQPMFIRRPGSERRLSVSSSISHQSTTTTTSQLYPGSTADPGTSFGTSPVTNSTLSNSTLSSPHPTASETNTKIIRPSLNNNSIHHLSTLSHSNHTLSPYTRSLLHFTVRSVPPRTASGDGLNNLGGMMINERQQSVKAKRKRLFRIGGNKSAEFSIPSTTGGIFPYAESLDIDSQFSPPFNAGGLQQHPGRTSFYPNSGVQDPMTNVRTHHLQQRQFTPSEFDMEDMDRYFRSNDDLPLPPPLSSVDGSAGVNHGIGPSSSPKFSTLPAVPGHPQQEQGVNSSSPGVTASHLWTGTGTRRRQGSSNPSRLR